MFRFIRQLRLPSRQVTRSVRADPQSSQTCEEGAALRSKFLTLIPNDADEEESRQRNTKKSKIAIGSLASRLQTNDRHFHKQLLNTRTHKSSMCTRVQQWLSIHCLRRGSRIHSPSLSLSSRRGFPHSNDHPHQVAWQERQLNYQASFSLLRSLQLLACRVL